MELTREGVLMMGNRRSEAEFGRAVIDLLKERGWNSISKREWTIQLLHSAH